MADILPERPEPVPDAQDMDVEIPDDEKPDPYELIENSDGSVDVTERETEPPEPTEFSENLANVFPINYLRSFGLELKELITKDKEDRKKRDEQYADGIRRTGLGNDAPGGAEFEGSSKAVHPMLAKGSIDFASRAVKELCPSGGPCRSFIVGEQSQEKLDKAERKRKYMNWQCNTQIEEYRPELERVLSQVPLAGAQYKRWWWDAELRRPRTEAVFIDDVFMPYGQADFYTSPRVAYQQRISKQEYDKRVRTGLYGDFPEADNPDILTSGDMTKSHIASDKIEGVEANNALVYNEDGLRIVWQVELVHDELQDDYVDRPAPYIIHLDDASGMIIGYFRNWKEEDDRLKKVHWMSEWPFIPWRGGPAVGLSHLIGSLAAASTGALRAILDSAHISTFPGAVKLAGGRAPGESIQVSPTEIKEIDAPPGVDDIRKLIMPFPFPGPSAVLFQIMEWLTQQAELVVATASEKIADAGNNMPVGTALALIEQGSVNFSAVHMRLHAAMARDLEILHRLNAENMADQETVSDLGEMIVMREDFLGPMDIIPVSDPNIFSETQRYAQLQAVMQLKNDPGFQQFFKQDALLARALKLLNVPDVDGIANIPKETKRMTPLEENYAAGMQERPLKVYPEQDDLVHLKSHIQFATSPMFGANPLIAAGMIQPMLQHCKEHMMALYRKHTKAATQEFIVQARMRGMQDFDPHQAELYGASFTEQLLNQLLGDMIMPGIQQMQKMAEQIAQGNQPKADPNATLQFATMKEIEFKKLENTAAQKGQELEFKKMVEAMDQKNDDADRALQERLAQLSTSVEMILNQQKQGSDMMMLEYSSQQETQQTVLAKLLDAALAPMMAAVKAGPEGGTSKTNVILPNGMDMAGELVAPMLSGLQDTIAKAIAGLQDTDSPMAQMIVGLAQQQQNFAEALQAQAAEQKQAYGVLSQGLQTVAQAVVKPPQPPQLPPPQQGMPPQEPPQGAMPPQPGGPPV